MNSHKMHERGTTGRFSGQFKITKDGYKQTTRRESAKSNFFEHVVSCYEVLHNEMS